MIRAMILDSYEWFKGLVEERRPLSKPEVAALADGSIFTGRQALQKKLVDELGGEDEAKGWLATKGVSADLKVIEWKPRDSGGPFPFFRAVATMAGLLGLSHDSASILGELDAERLFLDGLVSVWHP